MGFTLDLCAPAMVYLVISSVLVILMIIQNVGMEQTYCAGNISCNTSSSLMIFVLKIVYIIFWTWVLNLICDAGWTPLSWVLVLIPFILLFLMVGTFLLNSSGNISNVYY